MKIYCLFRFNVLLYVHGEQLGSCWDGDVKLNWYLISSASYFVNLFRAGNLRFQVSN